MKTTNIKTLQEFAKGINADINTHSNNISMIKSDNKILLFSYSTVIAYYDITNGIFIVTKMKYSATTSKHQYYLRQALKTYKEVNYAI